MWMAIAITGILAPSFIGLLQQGDYEALNYFGILTALGMLGYGIASNSSFHVWKRIPATMIVIMSCLWVADTASGFLFDVQINYPWWGIIEFSLLFVMFLNSFIQGLTEKTGCFAYVRKPLTFQDLLATVFGGCLVTTATEFQGKFYGFRKGKLIELTDFDKTKYERRNAPIALGEKIVANLGKPWRPWRNCVLIVWR